MKTTTAESVIERFRDCFARYGLPKLLVTDNGSPFCSRTFSEFLFKNGVNHNTSPPYHPATNGIAENAVRNFKRGVSKILEQNRGITFETAMNRYLFHYRNTVHTVTANTPSSLAFKHKVRTRLDLLLEKEHSKPSHEVSKEVKKLKVGEAVYCRDYRIPNKKTWVRAIIDEVIGDRVYLCKITNEDMVWKRHLD